VKAPDSSVRKPEPFHLEQKRTKETKCKNKASHYFADERQARRLVPARLDPEMKFPSVPALFPSFASVEVCIVSAER